MRPARRPGAAAPKAARLFLGLAALFAPLAFLPARVGGAALPGLLLALGTPLFLAPVSVCRVPPKQVQN
ncbi:hypothetical protein [Deinococcus hopiensis]|uniref:hypothetical protein n=1 Tax=Deinococcus hopiensis TaxID=309885 RepID=UPI000A059090|nr:hypothetical protein [Deinococcus hopiensis]